MKKFNVIWVTWVVLLLQACGGGGGGAYQPDPRFSTTNAPTLTLSLVDAAGALAANNAIGGGAPFFAKVLLKSETGAPVANSLVSFATDASVAVVAQSPVLTDGSGQAQVQISPASLTGVRAGSLVASASVNGAAVSAAVNFQTLVANVSLTAMTAMQPVIGALQSTTVTVEGRINGVQAGNAALTVNFSANCGLFSPASATSNSAGLVSSSYQSAANCSGPVTLTAQAAGASAATTVVNVTAAKAANVVFSSATTPLMVSSAAMGGLKQSTLKFQVLDSSGGAMVGQTLHFSLDPASISAGVIFTVSGNTALQTVTTDGNGDAAVTVSSGSLPTTVTVTAALAGNASVKASSFGVAVTSGRATQNSASLSVTKSSIEGFEYDGVQTDLTMRVADRQGNPVPAGAVVNFVTGHGSVQGTCVLNSASQCSVTYTSQGLRPANGRVAILAYMEGEESFTDTDGNNIWTAGEPFKDVGLLYRDDNENGAFDAGEQTYPAGVTGGAMCADAVYAYPSAANTCDGTWSSGIRVRRQAVIALATSEANIATLGGRTASGFTVSVSDKKGNAMPTGTAVAAEMVKVVGGAPDPTCKIFSVDPPVVLNSPNAGNHMVVLDGASDCATARVKVTVASPGGRSTVLYDPPF